MARESEIAKQDLDGELRLEEGGGNTFDVIFCQGDLSAENLQADQKAPRVFRPRGGTTHQSLRAGERVDPSFSFTAQMVDMSDAVLQTLSDFILFEGSYSGNSSTSTAQGDLKTLNLRWTVDGDAVGDASDHVLNLGDCHLVASFSEGQPNTISISGTCYGDVTMT